MTINLAAGGPSAAELLAAARKTGVTIFGAGGFARSLAKALLQLDVTVAALVVTTPLTTSCDDLPVMSLGTLGEGLRQLPMWIGVFNRESASDLSSLSAHCHSAGVLQTLLPQHYYEAVSNHLGWRFWLGDRKDYLRHAAAIQEAYCVLADEESRRFFAATLAFRLGQTNAPAPLPGPERQYFPPAIVEHVSGPLYVVDGGAYDGDTLAEASQHMPVAGAYAFEPDPQNFSHLVERMTTLGLPVVCFPCGLSDETRMVGASLGQGEGSTVVSDGKDTVQVVRLDDCLSSMPISYIKLDVEGHEIAALAGSRAILRRQRPMLAIAGYHRHDDLWRIPLLIRELDLGYRITYHVHMSNTFDCVYYAHATPEGH